MGCAPHGSEVGFEKVGTIVGALHMQSLEAANALARSGVLGTAHTQQHEVIPIRDDEPQVVAGRAINKKIMDALNPLGLSSPWVR